jgi:hypothetical protein
MIPCLFGASLAEVVVEVVVVCRNNESAMARRCSSRRLRSQGSTYGSTYGLLFARRTGLDTPHHQLASSDGEDRSVIASGAARGGGRKRRSTYARMARGIWGYIEEIAF